MRKRAYVSHHLVHVGKSENLSKSSLLVMAQVICVYAFHFPPAKGELWAWQFRFLHIKEEKQNTSSPRPPKKNVFKKGIIVGCAKQQRKVLILTQNKHFWEKIIVKAHRIISSWPTSKDCTSCIAVITGCSCCFDHLIGSLSLSPSPSPSPSCWRSSTQIPRPHSEVLEQTLSIRNKQNKLFPFSTKMC